MIFAAAELNERATAYRLREKVSRGIRRRSRSF
jgi:hypothetical protein